MDKFQYINRNLEVNDGTRIRLNCQRLSNFGLGPIFTREQHLLVFFTCREAYITYSALFQGEALRIALRTDYKKRSTTIKSVKCATGEVSKITNYRDGRGSIVPQDGKRPKHLNLQQLRSYVTSGRTKRLAPVGELHKDL